MKKKKNNSITIISLIMTAVLIVLTGLFCTSPSKLADEPFIPEFVEYEDESDDETFFFPVFETEPESTYETINIDLDVTVTDPPETEEPSEETKTGTTYETYGETEAVTAALTEKPDEPETTTEPETEAPKDPPPFSAESFKQYTGRELGPDEKMYDRYVTSHLSIIISKVEKGDLKYFICDIRIDSPRTFHTAFAGSKITGRAYTSKIASQVGAVFAVNGDFCGFRTSGIIIREGALYRNKGSDWDLCYLDKNGDMVLTKHSSVDAKSLVSNGAYQSWSFGPALVKNGRALTKDEFVTPGLSRSAREPRTAIGQVGKLHYIILVVDAVRSGGSTIGGMTFSDLAQTMASLGCKNAYNLDGGGSTTLYYKGKVINEPCINGERNISDIIYFK